MIRIEVGRGEIQRVVTGTGKHRGRVGAGTRGKVGRKVSGKGAEPFLTVLVSTIEAKPLPVKLPATSP